MIRREPAIAIAAVIAVAFTAVAAFVVLWFPEREMRSARAALQHKADTQAELVAYTLAPAIDFGDFTMVEEVLGGAARDDDFVSIEVRDPAGTVIRTRGEAREGEAVVAAEAQITSAGRDVGTLRLVMSEARIQSENHTQLVAASSIALTILLLGLLVASLVVGAVRRVASLTAQNATALAAKERAETRARFMSVLSHEVRTPLNGVLGIADALARRPLDTESRTLAASMLRSGQSLLELINDVLDSAKLESGRVEIEQAPFDPEASALRVVETLTALSRAKGLELVVDVAASVPRVVRGDRHRTQQVLTNLVGNAIKFTESGHVRVRLGWRARGGAEGTAGLEIAVEDTGIGIPEDKQAVVFEAFSQADASTTRRFGGTGLGLTISRDLVRLLGGELRLRSAVGEGTTFFFALPVEQIEGAPETKADDLPRSVWLVTPSAAWAEVVTARCEDRGIVVRRIDDAALEELVSVEREVLVVRDAALGAPSTSVERALNDAMGGGRVRLVVLASAFETSALSHVRGALLAKPFGRGDLDGALRARGQAEPVRDSRPDVALRSTARVLVADDDRVNRLVMKVLFDELGGQIELVADGREVIERTSRAPAIDLLLVDGEMPEIDGFEAVRRIREREAKSGAARLVILMVSAHARELLWPRAEAAGADGYLAKPVTREALTTLLREHAAALVDRLSSRAPQAEGEEASLRAVFEESTAQSLAALGQAIRAKEHAQAARHAHKLKGTCLVFGALAMAEAAAALETALATGVEADVIEHMFALEIAAQEHAARNAAS